MHPIDIEIQISPYQTTSTDDILSVSGSAPTAADRAQVGVYMHSKGWVGKHVQRGGIRTRLWTRPLPHRVTTPGARFDNIVFPAACAAGLFRSDDYIRLHDRFNPDGSYNRFSCEKWSDEHKRDYWAQRLHMLGWWYYRGEWHRKVPLHIVAESCARWHDLPRLSATRLYADIESPEEGRWKMNNEKRHGIAGHMRDMGFTYHVDTDEWSAAQTFLPRPMVLAYLATVPPVLHSTVDDALLSVMTYHRFEIVWRGNSLFIEIPGVEADPHKHRMRALREIVNKILTANPNDRI